LDKETSAMTQQKLVLRRRRRRQRRKWNKSVEEEEIFSDTVARREKTDVSEKRAASIFTVTELG